MLSVTCRLCDGRPSAATGAQGATGVQGVIPFAKITASGLTGISVTADNYFSSQTILTNLGTVETNTPSMTVTANQIIIPKTGYYLLVGSIVAPRVEPSTVLAPCSLQIFSVMGSLGTNMGVCRNETAAGNSGSGFGHSHWQVTGIFRMTIGDVIVLTFYQNSGSIIVLPVSRATYLSACLISE